MSAMRFRWLAFAFGILLLLVPGTSHAAPQISFGVNIGPPPVCPYGYFDYPPYNCAPYGYYGPEWFNGGIFIGAGPWFHGPEHFHGYVNHHFNPRFGYKGPLPRRGEHADAHHPVDHIRNFHGTRQRDGRGHEYHGK